MDFRAALLSAIADPNRALILFLIGCMLICRELVRPGRVLPGVFGLVAAIAASYSLLQYDWTLRGSILTGAALAMLAVQGFILKSWVPAAASGIMAALGAHSLIGPGVIQWPVALLAGCAAAAGALLLRTAIRARKNKFTF